MYNKNTAMQPKVHLSSFTRMGGSSSAVDPEPDLVGELVLPGLPLLYCYCCCCRFCLIDAVGTPTS